MKNQITLYPEHMDAGAPFDDVVIFPCKHIKEEILQDGEVTEAGYITEQCEESEAQFYGVFIHMPEVGLECIADCKTKELAEQLQTVLEITGRMFIIE